MLHNSWSTRSIPLIVVVALLSLFSTTFFSLGDFRPQIANAQDGEPTIHWVNPSSHSSELSDKPEQPPPPLDPGTAGTYHFNAWTANAPAGAIVEFELIQGDNEENQITLGRATRRGDAWDLFRAIPEFFPAPEPTTGTTEPSPSPTEGQTQGPPVEDGPAIVRAFLFPGEDQEPLATHDQPVEINQEDDDDPETESPEDQAETVEIVAPDNADRLGFFNRAAVIDVVSSAGTDDIEVFYTVSAPGTEPEWTGCGSETRQESQDGIRCTIEDDNDQPDEVTGVAAVPSNQVPSMIGPVPDPTGAEEPDPDSGDAHRVTGYEQIPSAVIITPERQNNVPVGSCTDNFTLLVNDQEGDKVAGADVDVHAQGPTDDLSFDTSPQTENNPPTDENKPPDQRHNSPTEAGRNCVDNVFGGAQGEHDRPTPNSDDIKHIEDADGTSDSGTFRFRLWSPFSGVTNITGWVDNNPDDRFCFGEPSDVASIGWGQAAPSPVGESPDPCPTATATTSPTATGTSTATATATATGTATSTASPSGTESKPPTSTSTATATATATATGTATATSTTSPSPTSTSPTATRTTSPSPTSTSPTATSTSTASPTSTTTTSPTATSTQPPVGGPASLTLSPDEDRSSPGTQRTYTARVTRANGTPVVGANVSWSTRGVGRFESTETTTDENGEAEAVVTSDEPGEQGITASTTCGQDLCTDTSSHRWGPRSCTILGTNGDDTLRGTSGRDVICGFDGDDQIRGLEDSDTVLGNNGRDVLIGSGGNDFISGGRGGDSLVGGVGRDSLRGGRGSDRHNGGADIDNCAGGPGRDRYRSCERGQLG